MLEWLLSEAEFVDKRTLITLLKDHTSATHRLLSLWSEVPLLLMLDVDWRRGPLVIVGHSDLMMWPLLPPGSLLQLDQKVRSVRDGPWREFERPIYLIEHEGKFHICHAERRRDTLRLISHAQSPERPSVSVPYRDARVRGCLTPIFRPLATRGAAAGRTQLFKR